MLSVLGAVAPAACGSTSGDAQDEQIDAAPGEPDAEVIGPPSIASVSPASALVHGGETVTITGSDLGGATSVTFGGTAATGLTVVDADTITVTAPAATAIDAPITVTTPLGMATEPHRYAGLYLATGSAGSVGSLYLVDPRDAFALSIAPLVTELAETIGVTGLAFDAAGTLYATRATRSSDGVTGGQLLTIDPDTGTVTLGPSLFDSVDGGLLHDQVPGIAFVGTTLYAFTESGDNLATIDTTTGILTALPDPTVSSWGSGLTVDADGRLVGTQLGEAGDVTSWDLATGAPTTLSTLDGSLDNEFPISGLTTFRGVVYGVRHAYYDNNNMEPTVGELITFDPDVGAITSLGALPDSAEDLASLEPAATALAPAPAIVANMGGRSMSRVAGPGCHGRTARVLTVGTKSLAAAALATRPDRRIALTDLFEGTGDVTVQTCMGDRRIAGAALVGASLKANQRGQLKLIDAKGRKLASDVIGLTR